MKLPMGLVFVALLLTSGCLAVSPDAIIKSSPVVQDFLKQYPNAEITATFYGADEFSQIKEQVQKECEKENVTPKDYYKVTITDKESGLSITAWVDWNRQIVECAVKKGTKGETIEPYNKEEMEGKGYHVCTDAEKNAEACTMDYKPVCGYSKDGVWKTYSNACTACSSGQVYKWKEGKCDESVKCESHHKVQCHDGNVYWYDSCGNAEEKKTYCEHGCEDGKCVELSDEDYVKKCYDGHVYLFDSEGNKIKKYKYCEHGCENAECIDHDEENCEESDDGFDIYHKGAAELGDKRLEDHCNDDGTLTEKYCEDSEIKWKTVPCPAGYVCDGGECVIAYGCEDSDKGTGDGLNYYEKGVTKAIVKGEITQMEDDYCGTEGAEKGYLREYYCEGATMKSKLVACPPHMVCDGGMCVNETETASVELALTPAYEGWSIKSVDEGNTVCENQYGEGWKWFEFHDDPNYGGWKTTGVLEHGSEFLDGKSHVYAWIWIYDQSAECFNLGVDHGLTFKVTSAGGDSIVNADCFGYDEYNGSSYYNPSYYAGDVKCNPYEGDTPCDETRSLLCIKKVFPERISECNTTDYGAYCTLFTGDEITHDNNLNLSLVGVTSDATSATITVNGEYEALGKGESTSLNGYVVTVDSITVYPAENKGSVGLKVENPSS